jgi:DNA-binding transcriptional regulator YiaG
MYNKNHKGGDNVKRVQLTKARESMHLTRREFAELIGVSCEHVRSLEYGRVKPSSQVLLKMCNVLKSVPEKVFPDLAN